MSTAGSRVSFVIKLIACASVTQLHLVLSHVGTILADRLRQKLAVTLASSSSSAEGEAEVDSQADDLPVTTTPEHPNEVTLHLVSPVVDSDQVTMICSLLAMSR